jgi:hypothetical protein
MKGGDWCLDTNGKARHACIPWRAALLQIHEFTIIFRIMSIFLPQNEEVDLMLKSDCKFMKGGDECLYTKGKA